ncbi:hypothetical protein QAD02_007649 [Eretmocerus hayati]|uniref:Uncharacterized protein n=1 Tax=Eretmocerus hayati TaxID=131215 RepID=A0ACC2N4A2_9HYME|nr:hypothetical protein QAD02_007649 [Eretmocerus hayati]
MLFRMGVMPFLWKVPQLGVPSAIPPLLLLYERQHVCTLYIRIPNTANAYELRLGAERENCRNDFIGRLFVAFSSVSSCIPLMVSSSILPILSGSVALDKDQFVKS